MALWIIVVILLGSVFSKKRPNHFMAFTMHFIDLYHQSCKRHFCYLIFFGSNRDRVSRTTNIYLLYPFPHFQFTTQLLHTSSNSAMIFFFHISSYLSNATTQNRKQKEKECECPPPASTSVPRTFFISPLPHKTATS